MDALDGMEQDGHVFMPVRAFDRPGVGRTPLLTRCMRRNGVIDFDAKPVIRLSRMIMARDMIAQLVLNIYGEGLDKTEAGRFAAWVEYDLPAREDPFRFTVRKVCGDPCLLETNAWENLGTKIVRQIMRETGYDVDDINYCLFDEARQHYAELYRIAGGATLMAHWAREREHTAVASFDGTVQRLSSIFVDFEDVLPFSKAKKMVDGASSTTRMEELAKELVKLTQGEETSLDDID